MTSAELCETRWRKGIDGKAKHISHALRMLFWTLQLVNFTTHFESVQYTQHLNLESVHVLLITHYLLHAVTA